MNQRNPVFGWPFTGAALYPFWASQWPGYAGAGYYGNPGVPSTFASRGAPRSASRLNPMPAWGWGLGAAAAGGALASGVAAACWPTKRVWSETLEEEDGKIMKERWVDDLGCFASPRWEGHYLDMVDDVRASKKFKTLDEAKVFLPEGVIAPIPTQNPRHGSAVVFPQTMARNPLPGPWWAWGLGGAAAVGVTYYCWPKSRIWSGRVDVGGETVELYVDYLGCWKSEPYLATYRDTLTGAAASRQFKTLEQAKSFGGGEDTDGDASPRQRNPKCTHCTSIDPFTGRCTARWCQHCELKDPFGGPGSFCHWRPTPVGVPSGLAAKIGGRPALPGRATLAMNPCSAPRRY